MTQSKENDLEVVDGSNRIVKDESTCKEHTAMMMGTYRSRPPWIIYYVRYRYIYVYKTPVTWTVILGID